MAEEDRHALLDEPESFGEWARHQAALLLEDLRAWSLFIFNWFLCHWPLGPIKTFASTESANFAVVNNEKSRLIAFQRKKKEGAWRTGLRWLCLLLMGVSVACLYQLIHGTMEIIQEWKFQLLYGYMKTGSFGLGWISHYGIMLMLIVSAGLLALWEPTASGGGVAEVISFLNGARPANLLSYTTFVFKAVGVTLAVSSGVFIGPEGPFIHLGSIAGARIPSILHFFFQKIPVVGRALESLMSDSEERNFVVAGAAVGIASAFRAPIGGTMFVLEEALSFFDSKLIFRTYFCCAVSYFTLKLLSEGHYLSTSSLTFSSAALQTTCYPGYAAVDLIMFAIMGVVAGLAGVLYNLIFIRCQMLRARIIKRWGWRKLLEIVIITFVTSLFIAFLPIQYGCSPASQLASHLAGFDETNEATFADPALYKQTDYCIASTTQEFFLNYSYAEGSVDAFLESKYLQTALCPEGYYNELASLIQVTGHEAVTLLFASGAYDMFHAKAVAIFGVVYFILCAVAAGMSVPAGIFVPSMTIGACLGRLLAIFTNAYVKIPMGLTPIDPGPWAMIGAAAFLCGSARITVTMAIIILEITGDFRYVPGIAIAVVFAKMTGGFFTKSIYHMMIHLKDIPFLEDIPSSAMDNVFVRDLMTSPVIVLHHQVSYPTLRHILENCNHNGFPVVKADPDEEEEEAERARKAMEADTDGGGGDNHGAGGAHGSGSTAAGRQPRRTRSASPLDEDDDRNVRRPLYVRLCGVILREHLERFVALAPPDSRDTLLIDVTRHMNETPFTVQPDFTMTQAFRMFRTLGLRHLPVVDKNFEVQGIITRRNFLESHHKPHVKQTTFELKTMRLFMQPLAAPAPRLRAGARPSLFADPDLVGDEPLDLGADHDDSVGPLRNVDLSTGLELPPVVAHTEYDTHNYGETTV